MTAVWKFRRSAIDGSVLLATGLVAAIVGYALYEWAIGGCRTKKPLPVVAYVTLAWLGTIVALTHELGTLRVQG
jgi:predicted membrane channel-forming protein YqfA (hemolysin III family)